MVLFCCASELGPPEDSSAIEVILYYILLLSNVYVHLIVTVRANLDVHSHSGLNAIRMKKYILVL